LCLMRISNIGALFHLWRALGLFELGPDNVPVVGEQAFACPLGSGHHLKQRGKANKPAVWNAALPPLRNAWWPDGKDGCYCGGPSNEVDDFRVAVLFHVVNVRRTYFYCQGTPNAKFIRLAEQ